MNFDPVRLTALLVWFFWGFAALNRLEKARVSGAWFKAAALFFGPAVWLWAVLKPPARCNSRDAADTPRRTMRLNDLPDGGPLSIFTGSGECLGSPDDPDAADGFSSLRRLLAAAAVRRAAEVLLEPCENGRCRVSFRIGGKLSAAAELDASAAAGIFRAAHLAAGTNVRTGCFIGRGKAVSGTFRAAFSILPAGEQLLIRLPAGEEEGKI